VATNSVFEIGITQQKIYSDKSLRILFQGQANKSVGFQRNNTFTRISTVCSSDIQSIQDLISPESDCYINVGNDLVVYTKHLTLFATYTQSVIPSDPTTPRPRKSGGGGGGGAIIPKKNITSTSLNTTNITVSVPEVETPKQENQEPTKQQDKEVKQESKARKIISRITGRVSEVVSSTTTGAVSVLESPIILVILAISAFLFISWAFIRWHRNIMLTYFNTPQDPKEYKY
jgi:hypothetical protein